VNLYKNSLFADASLEILEVEGLRAALLPVLNLPLLFYKRLSDLSLSDHTM